MKILVVAEKPDAATRIARALDQAGKPRRVSAPVLESKRDGHQVIVASALGHLYQLKEKGRTRRNEYPVYDVEWVPKYQAERGSEKTRQWIEVLRSLNGEADIYVNACDFDIEGSLIGYNILRYAFAASVEKCRRMKVSTLVEREIREAFENLQPTLDFNLIRAGETRHTVDFIYGVNLSRALTLAVKPRLKTHFTLSTGRVQGPTLRFLFEREVEARTFVPVPYWSLTAKLKVRGGVFEAEYEAEKVERRSLVDKILSETSGRKGVVMLVKSTSASIPPPSPFDLGTLQSEAYRAFRFTPSRTLNLAERLYLQALISYPRTSSQKLPPGIGYRETLGRIGENAEYRELVKELLAQPELTPAEGKREDPAHPAIYPTGQRPERELSQEERRLLDLVTRRFLAVFAPRALRESVRVEVGVGGHKFLLRGRRLVEEGWTRFYRPYAEYSEERLPVLAEGEEVEVLGVYSYDKYTSPPPRYNPASVIRMMEETGIGTKATRAEIFETLYKRGYIYGERIEVTGLGLALVETLQAFCPKVVSVELTRQLDGDMEGIEYGRVEPAAVVEKAVRELDPALKEIMSREEEIGEALSRGVISALATRRTVGPCPVCATGSLVIIRSKKTGKQFIGCTNYSKKICAYSAPLPQHPYVVTPVPRKCSACSWPMVRVSRRGMRPWHLCVNTSCPSRAERRKKTGEGA